MNSRETPSVAVIMPARNAAPHIETSIRSVLESTAVRELIVVNDMSTDDTGTIVSNLGQQDPRVTLVPGPGQGISMALNAGLASAQSKYICRCDSDDLFVASRLDFQLPFLESNPEFCAVSGGFTMIDQDDRELSELACHGPAENVTLKLKQGVAITHFCTWLTRRAAITAIGGARQWFQTAEDLDLQFRLAEQGEVWHEPRPFYHYRIHNESITHQQTTDKRLFYENCAKAFAKERTDTGSDPLMRGEPPEPPTSEGKATSANSHKFDLLCGKAWREQRQGKYRSAIQAILNAIGEKPFALTGWKSLLLISSKGLKQKLWSR